MPAKLAVYLEPDARPRQDLSDLPFPANAVIKMVSSAWLEPSEHIIASPTWRNGKQGRQQKDKGPRFDDVEVRLDDDNAFAKVLAFFSFKRRAGTKRTRSGLKSFPRYETIEVAFVQWYDRVAPDLLGLLGQPHLKFTQLFSVVPLLSILRRVLIHPARAKNRYRVNLLVSDFFLAKSASKG